MNSPTIRILLVEDNAWDAHLVGAMLARGSGGGDRPAPAAGAPAFLLEIAQTVGTAIPRLRDEHFDVVLLDLMLPDSEGIETLKRIREANHYVAIVVQTSLDDESTGVEAMKAGAEDYLVKGHVDVDLLRRTIRHAIERHRLQLMVRQLSLTDDLTGLLNRRGFHTLGEQHLKVARRGSESSVLIMGDLDRFKEINDQHGHQMGDRALATAAEVLRQTFRDSDIIARIGGDEFLVLAIGSDDADAASLIGRLADHLAAASARLGLPHPLSMSMGRIVVDPRTPHTLEQLIAQADGAMYAIKRAKRALGEPTPPIPMRALP